MKEFMLIYKHTQFEIGGDNMYKLDMHVHTSDVSSCGMVPSYEVVELYKSVGYNGIVITDHFYRDYFEKLKHLSWFEQIDNYLLGYKSALKYAIDIKLNILLGIEMRFDESDKDYLVYGVDEQFLKENERLYEFTLKEFKELIQDKDILIFQAHPYRNQICPSPAELLHGVEVFNGNPRHNSQNALAFQFAEKNHLIKISGSDFHQIQDLAKGGIKIENPICTNAELIKLLKYGSYNIITSGE